MRMYSSPGKMVSFSFSVMSISTTTRILTLTKTLDKTNLPIEIKAGGERLHDGPAVIMKPCQMAREVKPEGWRTWALRNRREQLSFSWDFLNIWFREQLEVIRFFSCLSFVVLDEANYTRSVDPPLEKPVLSVVPMETQKKIASEDLSV